MIRVIILLAFFFIIFDKIFAQNLISNPSFEQYSECPSFENQLYLANEWYSPTKTGSPDYFNACDTLTRIFPEYPNHKFKSLLGVPKNNYGFQYAKEGDAYAGFYFTYTQFLEREYIQQKLHSNLIKNKKYLFSAFISLKEASTYSLNQLDICFSKKQPKVKEVLILETGTQPREILKCKCSMKIKSDTVWDNKEEWVQIEGEYTAKGGEQYITIGLFEKSIEKEDWEKMAVLKNHISDRAYYYIDNIKLEEVKLKPKFR